MLALEPAHSPDRSETGRQLIVAQAEGLDALLEPRVLTCENVDQALPAHGHPFNDLKARCDAIKRHHDERLDKVKAIGRDLGPATVRAYSRRLFKPRSWGAMAESETYAHLEHLRVAGDAESRRDDQDRLIYETG